MNQIKTINRTNWYFLFLVIIFFGAGSQLNAHTGLVARNGCPEFFSRLQKHEPVTIVHLGTKNTILQPVQLTAEEIQVVVKSVEKGNALYDPKVKLLTGKSSKHYHSDLEDNVPIHATLPSLNYAVALLDSRIPENRQRAFEVLDAVLKLQDQDPNSKTFGIWPYNMEEPLATKKSPADRNWADFCAVQVISIINNHNDILPDGLKKRAKSSLLNAANEIRLRDVRPDYTNISLMGLYVCYMTADMYDDSSLMTYARKRLKSFYDCTLTNKGFIEYNSPAYNKLSLDEVLRLKEHVINKSDHAMLDSIYHIGWRVIARHYHQPSAQWAGPHGRCYSVLLGRDTYNWLYTASAGRIHPDVNLSYSKDQDPALKHKIPEYLIPYFISPKLPRLEIDTFIVQGQQIELNPMVSYQEKDKGVIVTTHDVIGKSYLTRDFVLSSANRSCLWNQRRPLIAYWGTENKPVSMQIRFLHDMYDYASANIFCSQDSSHVLGGINFTTNGGDRHVTIDPIKNATIKAKDLRLRFEFGGDIKSIRLEAPVKSGNSVTGYSGRVNFKVELPSVKFDHAIGSLETGGDDKNKWIDLILYSGDEKEFDFDKIKEAAIGFLLTLSNQKIGNANSVVVKNSDNLLDLRWKGLAVKVQTKPYQEMATIILK